MTDESSDFAQHNPQHLGLDLAVRYHEDIGDDRWGTNRGHYQDFVMEEMWNTDLAQAIEPKTDFLAGATPQEKRNSLITIVNTELDRQWGILQGAINRLGEPSGYSQYYGGYIDYYPWDE